MFSKKEEAKALLKKMTLREKALLCSGGDYWHTKAMPSLGVEPIFLADGPHGLRKQAGKTDHLGINDSVPSTAFPSACLSACSFDRDLLRQMGAALAEEALQEGVSLLLGPGMNIKRTPLCGRNFEYLSEDPCLSGELATAATEGIQSKGVGACLKHYLAKSQETHSVVFNAIIDPRALHEIYLAGYGTVIEKAQPWSVMAGYNLVNGKNMAQNRPLLTEALRDRFHYEGMVVSDWGATVDRLEDLKAGLDLEMPYDGPFNDETILRAVESGDISEEELDTHVLRNLMFLLAAQENLKPEYRFDQKAHHALAKKIACESAVLLKNEDHILPLDKGQRVAVIGAYAEEPRIQGAGSSRVVPIQVDKLCESLSAKGVVCSYAPGYHAMTDDTTEDLLSEAERTAEAADVAVVCIGSSRKNEAENKDRADLTIPACHIELLQRVAAKNQNVVVLLFGAGAVEMEWLENAKALLELFLGGEAIASAAAELLLGDVNPSGKLAESFAMKLGDYACTKYHPGEGKNVEFRESIYVGYRYFDKVKLPVRFPFGFGLSYTEYRYKDLRIGRQSDGVAVSVTVQNVGTRAGAEIVQFYVSQKNPSVYRPVWELRDFDKVYLEPGEEKTVTVKLPLRAFCYFDPETDDFVLDTDEYLIRAAASSRDEGCVGSLQLTGTERRSRRIPAAYECPAYPFTAGDEDYREVFGGPIPDADWKPGDPLSLNSTIGEIQITKAGTELVDKTLKIMEQKSGDLKDMFYRARNETPMRSIPLFTRGAITQQDIRDALAEMNRELYPKTGR